MKMLCVQNNSLTIDLSTEEEEEDPGDR